MSRVLRLPPLPTIRDILKLYNVSAMKRLSQNFILDEKLSNKIVKKAGYLPGSYVLEVGPGPGALTRSILRHSPEKLIVIEKDTRFKPVLEMLTDAYAAVNGKMDVIYDDIMKVDLTNLFPESVANAWDGAAPKIYIIGNLPFNVSTPLIIKWIQAISEKKSLWMYGRTRMTLTFQKEVAERLVAEPLNHQRCRLSIVAQAWTQPILRFIIPGSAFLPKPQVDVGVVTFVPLVTPRTKHEHDIFTKVTRHIFSFRQKHSVKGIGTLFPLERRKELGEIMYKLADLNPKIRPMQLTVEEIDRLVSAYKYLLEKHPELKLYEYRASRRILGLSKIKDVELMESETL
ncbi:mitochondrial transcription factor B1 [Nomia melanderi]|uniref:mitochondrial transcription factor B1 n=1 Tax=Nomia melanderi TaxID=2448451 RepID=UPI00130413F3|nr:dimethyladenosine transferase 1, mitochondrial [Nomia melanderi]